MRSAFRLNCSERRSEGFRIIDMKLQFLWVLSLVAGAGMAQPLPRQKIDVSKLGPQVGTQVPDFSLKDQNGKVWTRQSIMGPKGLMLVFVRSADW